MTIQSFRMVKAKWADAALTGEGAREFGGRWNSSGTAIIYSSGSLSLALLELMVHVNRSQLLNQYVVFELRFEAELVQSLAIEGLPADWRAAPPSSSTQRIGDEWVARGRSRAGSAILRVPSVVVPSEVNYLINPDHPDFKRIVATGPQAIAIDPRLLRQ